MFNFLNNNRKDYIHTFLKNKIIPNLNTTEYNNLIYLLYVLIEYISVRFAINPDNYSLFWDQLIQNNNRDIIGLFNLLLPYIDDVKGTYELHKEIYSLSDISLKKNNEKDDSKNKYKISNVQYNLYNDGETKYSFKFINKNFNLLLDTIDKISSKLFVNWINIVPLTLTNYKKSYLYIQSIRLTYFRTNRIDIRIDGVGNVQLPIDESYLATVNNEWLDNQELSRIYQHWDIDSNKNILLNKENLFLNKGIGIGDIFNTIYYDLFYDVLNIKWFIYQGTFEDLNHDEIYIKKFNQLIAIPELYLNKKYHELNVTEQNKFGSKWTYFINMACSENNQYFYMLLSIIKFFERNYDKISSIVKLFNYQKLTDNPDIDLIDNDDVELDDEKHVEIEPLEFLNRISVLPLEDIYTYLVDSIQQFRLTWYGKNIILNINNSRPGELMIGLDNIKFNYDTYFDSAEFKIPQNELSIVGIFLPETLDVKYKFIYNYAKSFTLIYINDRQEKRPSWHNMTQIERINMIKLLNYNYIQSIDNRYHQQNQNPQNQTNPMSFNKYYSRTYQNSTILSHGYNTFDNSKINNLSNYLGNKIYQYIRDKLIDITFETHIMKGLLSEFIFEKNLTDNSYLGNNYSEKNKNRYLNLKKFVFNKNSYDYLNNAYYFLNNSTYSELNDVNKNGSKKSYFQLICSDYRWYSFYSMDWVSQINFFHKYINNRVIYITGATGQGKSTQVPKLFLYSLKMIDRNERGKIICSQPRIKPVIENSEQISYELGVPIVETSNNYKKNIKTFNSYVQYQTQNESHTVIPHNGLMLKVVTDKLLFMELLKYPYFKDIEKSHNENKGYDCIENNVYKKHNLYDIIIVDESHEHNTNMDFILTIARDTVRINNSLKLVIVSATMADDEPIYRRYYKEIDDNFLYPYSLYNAEFDFNRFYVDRRMDISPPGETTQHKITEYYLKEDPPNYIIAQELAIKRALDIANTTDTGDILLFSDTVNHIKEICTTLNKQLSKSDIICLPFYRELPKRWEIFNNLSKNLRKINIDRQSLFDDIDNKTNIKFIPENTYKRCIIVATNIAEASITIDSLKFVIDTGFFISVSDNYTTIDTNIETKKISEVSRVQRKGRVGRVGSGTVYYMYAENSRKYIKTDYGICNTNIFNELYDIMANNNSDKKYIISYTFANDIDTNIDDNFINYLKNKHKLLFTSNIFQNIILPQYTIYNIILPSIINFIYTKTSVFSINLNKSTNITYNFENTNNISLRSLKDLSGYYIKDHIFDCYGEFYIIHPDENIIKRNLLNGEIIKVNNNVDNSIISIKIYTYLQQCFNYNLIIDNNIEYYPITMFYSNQFNTLQLNYEKSVFGRILNNIKSEFTIVNDVLINNSFLYTIIYSSIVDLDNVVIMMISLLLFSKFKLSNLNKNYKIFGLKYGYDDLYIYYMLSKQIIDSNILKTKLDNSIKQYEDEKKLFIDEKNKIMDNLKNKNNNWNLNIPYDVYKKFNELYNENKLDRKNNINEYLKKSINTNYDEKYLHLLNSLLIECNINDAITIFKQYEDLYTNISTKKNTHNTDFNNNDLLWFKENVPFRKEINEFANIKKAFIYGFGSLQTVIYSNKYDKYYSTEHIKKQFNYSKDSLTKKNTFMIYLSKIRDDMLIMIDSNIDTLVECNMYNYNPFKLYNINLEDTTSRVFKKLLKVFYSIHNVKYKYINNLKVLENNSTEKENLYNYSNNYTKYIIKLWSSETKQTLYFNKQKILQNGGENLHFKIKIIKINKILQKINISLSDFFNILDQLSKDNYKIYIKDDYFFINN